MSYIRCVLTLLIFLGLQQVFCIYCNETLGMKDGRIKNNQLKAAGSGGGTVAIGSRLGHDNGWCNDRNIAWKKPFIDPNIYLQIDLLKIHRISGFSLTGYIHYTPGNFIQLSYKINDNDRYIFYKQKISVFGVKYPAIKYIKLEPPIHAQYLRYHPENDQNHKCVQIELYGCAIVEANCLTPILNKRMRYNASSSVERLVPSYIAQPNSNFPWGTSFSSGNSGEEYVQIDLLSSYVVTGVRTFEPTYVKKLQQPDTFSIQYKNGESNMHSYTGKSSQSFEFATEATTKILSRVEPPFSANIIKILPKNKGKSIYLKLQFYGCLLSDSSIFRNESATTTTSSTLPVTTVTTTTRNARTSPTITPSRLTAQSSTSNPQTTPRPKAEIKFYEILQGHKFRDVNYVGQSTKDRLHNGRGVLVDGVHAKDSNPADNPEFWVGWKKNELPHPYIIITLVNPAVLDSVDIFSYADRSEGLGPFSSCQILYSENDKGAWSVGDYACPVRWSSPGITILRVHLAGKVAKRLKLQFNYSAEFLLFSEIILNAGNSTGVEFLTLSKTPCKIAAVKDQHSASDSSSSLIIGIVVSITVIVLAVLICLIYRYRKKIRKGRDMRLRKKKLLSNNANGNDIDNYQLLKNITKNPTYEVSFKGLSQDPDHTYTEVTGEHDNEKVTFLSNIDRRENNEDAIEHIDNENNIYAAPCENVIGYTEVSVDQLRDTQKYAEPDIPVGPDNVELNPIYERVKIYEDPYQTVTGSSLYADPNLESDRKSIEIRKFPRDRLKFLEKIGTGQFGEVHICEVESLGNIVGSDAGHCNWIMSSTIKVAVKLLKTGVDKNVEKEFMKEVRVMARLQHENVVQLLGICEEDPKCMVVEYMENGDLNQFLHNYSFSKGPADLSDLPSTLLNKETLMYMCLQIANGMNYLSSQGFIHRDLATRNCLVGHSFTVKIADFGMSRYLYSKQYYRIEGRAVLPIRWMAPESLFYGTFTSQSDVWAYGVTIWEIFTFAREAPYNHLSDQQVIDNACSVVAKQRRSFRCLPQPDGCSFDIYQLLLRCWERSPADRPTFHELAQFFQSFVNSAEASV